MHSPLLWHGRAAKPGVFLYAGWELGRPELRAVRAYRPEDEVFDDESLKSYASKPITLNHLRDGPLVIVGHIDGPAFRDGGFVGIRMRLTEAAAPMAASELSTGYYADYDWTAGTAPDGSPYDVQQIRIRARHVAFVTTAKMLQVDSILGRGSGCRILNRVEAV